MQSGTIYSLRLSFDFFFSSLTAFFSLGVRVASFFFSLRASCALAMMREGLKGKRKRLKYYYGHVTRRLRRMLRRRSAKNRQIPLLYNMQVVQLVAS